MQINDGSGWKSLPVLKELDALDGGAYGFSVPWDQTIPGFASASALSAARSHAMFRAKGQEGPGFPYWVDLSATPELLPGKPMTVWLTLAPADLSEAWTNIFVSGRLVYSGPAVEEPSISLRPGEVLTKSTATRIQEGEPIPWSETHETIFHKPPGRSPYASIGAKKQSERK